jgi:hypothetical protein
MYTYVFSETATNDVKVLYVYECMYVYTCVCMYAHAYCCEQIQVEETRVWYDHICMCVCVMYRVYVCMHTYISLWEDKKWSWVLIWL